MLGGMDSLQKEGAAGNVTMSKLSDLCQDMNH